MYDGFLLGWNGKFLVVAFIYHGLFIYGKIHLEFYKLYL
jgi:hypothetical protein